MVPVLDKAFRRHKRAVGRRWRMDETYIRVRGQWKYLYRAVDTNGQTIDSLLTAKRDAAAALRFFHKAIRHHGEPEVVTIDKSGANTAALTTLNDDKPDEALLNKSDFGQVSPVVGCVFRQYARFQAYLLSSFCSALVPGP